MVSGQQILALAALVLLQVPGAPRGDSMSGLIVGQVVDGDSGRPLRGALVVLAGPSPPGGGAHPRILTGDDGRFVYRALRSGQYNIYAYKGGYVDGAQGRRRPAGQALPLLLADGQRTDDAVVRMWKHAAISGTVIDEAGERLIGVRIQAYRRAIVAGARRYLAAGDGMTDDRGIYRIGGLIPGEYIVGAVAQQASPSATSLRMVNEPAGSQRLEFEPGAETARARDVGSVLRPGAVTPPPAHDGRLYVYPPTFHPHAPTGEAASVIPLRAGSEYVNADLQLAPVATVSITGYVAGPDGPVTRTPLRLVASNTAEIGLVADSISTTTDRSGSFIFPAVPSGHYSLRLLRGVPAPSGRIENAPNTVAWTDLPLNVGGEDIENLMVEALPGIRIAGRVMFEGVSRGAMGGPVVLAIEAADQQFASLPSTSVRVDANGEFRSPPLPGGQYYVRVPNSPDGWMFKSATSDGRDVVDTPLAVSADVLNVLVTFTDRWSGLNGFVQNRQRPDDGAAVLVFPTDTDAWVSSGAHARRVRAVRTGRTGEYSVNLPPGDYYVLAVAEAQTADWQDPAFLDAASRAATRVSIAEGERTRVDLRTREIQ